MKKLLFYLPLIFVSACKDNPEQIPAYLNLKPFEVSAPGGAAWQKITDGWVYANGQYLGAYTLPALVPVLAEGETEIIVFPGVKENGIEGTPNIYPYLARFTKNYTLTGGQTTVVQAVTDYDPKNKYPFGVGRGDFDGGSFIALENRDSDGALDVQLTTDGALAGKCILMVADTSHPIMDVATEKMENLPTLGAPEVWLEMEYQTDVPFFLYLLSGANEKNKPVFQFNLSENWNKIYINLTSAIVDTQESEQRLYFRLSLPKDSAGKYTQNSGTVRIDNVKVVHF